jgi:type 2 lantibiotic biosynthesis protein LanM
VSAGAAKTRGSGSPGTLIDTTWWVRGLALHERSAGTVPATDATSTASSGLLDLWRTGYGSDGGGLAARLAEVGLDESGLVGLLDEPPESLAARVARPSWVDTVERALQAPVPPPGEVPADWREAFAIPLRPLVAGAVDRLTELAGRTAREVDLAAVAATVATWLSRRLVAIATRTFVLELHERRSLLAGADPRARFVDFIRGLAEPGAMAELLARYPVLARLLGEASDVAAEAIAELLTRFAEDRALIVATLLDGTDPGRVVAVAAGQGDPHQRGRAVAILRFADGRRVVYRPRDVEAHLRFAALVERLNEALPGLRLRTAVAIARAGYGWLEHVQQRPMTAPDQVDLFYRRQGALLALLHAVDGADIHCENLIACADQPVLVDVETLFHPSLPLPGATTDPAAEALAASVHRTALLPFLMVGEHGVLDLSGLGGDRGALTPSSVVDWDFPGTDRMRLTRRAVPVATAHNQPALDGAEIDPLDHECALQEGFRAGYDAILRHRDEFAEILNGCTDLEIRVVVRPTAGYASLLDESTHPDLLRDALDRDRALDTLWRESAKDPMRLRLAGHELRDLWAGDVPVFFGRPGARDLWTSGRHRLPDVLDTAALRGALDKLGAMGEADRRDQEWIISATLATRRRLGLRAAEPAGDRPDEHGHVEDTPGLVAGSVVQPQRLLTAACEIADQIVARSLTGAGRVNWLGLELVDERQWLVLPMGGGLANGYLGVALFLAQLSEVSGVGRYAELARSAISAAPALLDTLTERADLVAMIGRGGLHGLGGMAYGLARLATLLDDPEVREWTGIAVQLAATAPDTPGWARGSAGCLAAMTAVHAELGMASAARLAEECAADTAALVDRAPGIPEGFADGWAGVAWSLAACAPARFASAARTALDQVGEVDFAVPGWCRGAAGRLVAQQAVRGVDPDYAVGELGARSPLRDLSLCHGELGVAEAMTVVAGHDPCPNLVSARRGRAAVVLRAIDRYGASCGTPGWVSTPGLLSGLAGIGYGLLRLGFPQRVPSVMLLRPRPGSAT